jgi:alanyl-tRNA synthetase
MECHAIRHRFITYYQQHDFRLLPPAPLLHPSVPMSFVMSAGLGQIETSLANVKNRDGNKFVLVQDCFRHFDREAVGNDATHLSLFEMPAAFMFGNNKKEIAINHLWQLATEILGIEVEHLWVSYFAGGKLEGQQLPKDKTTYQTWREIGVPDNRLVGLGIKDNYWVQGKGLQNIPTNPRKCGPSTELFYDRGIETNCGSACQPGCPCGRFIEFANLLFIAYTVNPQTNVIELMADPFVETVIGTERTAMILQRVDSVFDLHNYRAVLDGIENFIMNKDLPLQLIRKSKRIIVDHLRALCALVKDGAPPPGKNGRERLIKLLIRSIITQQILLGIIAKDFLSVIIQLVAEFLAQNDKMIFAN